MGRRLVVAARNAAAAVALFRRRYHLSRCRALRADPETGGWMGLSVAPEIPKSLNP